MSGAAALILAGAALGQGQSSRVMLQLFESPWNNSAYRTIDIWECDYKDVWVPPGAQADLGDFSVGYDVYDRFDFGTPTNPTLYGTSTDAQGFLSTGHRAGLYLYADIVLNHNGYSDNDLSGFQTAGDYPGFVINAAGAPWGDFHDPAASSEQDQRIAGLIDIDQSRNLMYIRHPVSASDSRNIPKGTVPLFGRLADVPKNSNKQFYPDLQGQKIQFTNTETGQRITKYRYSRARLLDGDAVVENATGLLTRYVQWMLEVAQFDGFRIDAQKHIPQWFFDQYYDNATYQSGRKRLNGQWFTPLSFGEIFDGDKNKIFSYVKKDGFANRDALDIPLYFALESNLQQSAAANDWRSVVNSGLDTADNGFMDGSVGVRFVESHDVEGVYMSNVAHAYLLPLPGRSIVYFNAKQFGDNRSFPKNGRGDALGGRFGNTIKTLVGIVNGYARGFYYERWLSKENLIYERDANLLVALSNRTDAGYDTFTVQTAFEPGTVLQELTGNSESSTIDPQNQVAKYIQVDGSGRATVTVPRNASTLGRHDTGYVMYGPPAPQGSASVTNVAQVLQPDGNGFNDFENGNNRLNPIYVITASTFDIVLQTQPVVNGSFGEDAQAGGDNAVFRINEGVNATGQGYISTNPEDDVVYGFQQFVTKRSPLFSGGDGEYRQTVNSALLPTGLNYITVRAFRQRAAGDGSAIFTDFQIAVRIDR